jgi:hypothetical protein
METGRDLKSLVALAEAIVAIGNEPVVVVNLSRGPADLDRLDTLSVSQSDVGPGIVRRLVTAPSQALGDDAATTTGDRNARPQWKWAFATSCSFVATLLTKSCAVSRRSTKDQARRNCALFSPQVPWSRKLS